jgi:hypothetical protein
VPLRHEIYPLIGYFFVRGHHQERLLWAPKAPLACGRGQAIGAMGPDGAFRGARQIRALSRNLPHPTPTSAFFGRKRRTLPANYSRRVHGVRKSLIVVGAAALAAAGAATFLAWPSASAGRSCYHLPGTTYSACYVRQPNGRMEARCFDTAALEHTAAGSVLFCEKAIRLLKRHR